MYLLNRRQRHRVNYTWMIVSLLLVASLPFLLFLGLYLKSFLLIHDYHLGDLLFSKVWKPGKGQFGFYPFIVGSIWVTLLAMFISAPVCLLTAIYVTQYTKKRFMRIMHPAIDILAGIPSVVYVMLSDFASCSIADVFIKFSSTSINFLDESVAKIIDNCWP